MNIKKSSQITGWSILLIVPVVMIPMIFVFPQLIIPDNWPVSYDNVQASPSLYLLGIVSWVIIAALDLFASFGVYHLYRNHAPVRAAWLSALRAVYTLILLVAILYLAMGMSVNSPEELRDAYEKFHFFWQSGLAIFGIHLLVWGNLCYQSKTPVVWTVLFVVAGIGYFFLDLAKVVGWGENEILLLAEQILSLPMMAAEVGFAIRLLIKSRLLPVDGVSGSETPV